MSELIPEQPVDAPSFTPTLDLPLSEEDAFDAMERTLEEFPDDVDLIVASDEPTPVGRSWAFDWQLRTFAQPAATGPKQTYGDQTLTGWVEKALRTGRGAHPIHPPDYGFDQPEPALIGGRLGEVPADLEDRVRECVTFHERISDIEDFVAEPDDANEALMISFTLVLDDETDVPFSQNATLSLRL